MGLALVKFHGLDALQPLYALFQLQGRVVGYVGHHDLRRSKGGEFPVHQIQARPGLSIVRQVFRYIVADLHPVSGERTENGQSRKNEENDIPLIHDDTGQALHEAGPLISLQIYPS